MSMANKRRYWTDEEIEYLKANYGVEPLEDIAKKICRTEQSIKAFASRHQIYAHYWTEEETEYLIEKYGIMSDKNIAKKLGKTVSAIYNKVHCMDLGNVREQTERIHLGEASRLLGHTNNYLLRRWIGQGLKTYKLGRYVMIDPMDLTKWMENHQDEWSAMACETYFFDNNDWFHKKLLEERDVACKERWKGY